MNQVDNIQIGIKTMTAAAALIFAVWLAITPGHALPAYLLAGSLSCYAVIQLITVAADYEVGYRIASRLNGMTTVPLLLAAAIAKMIA